MARIKLLEQGSYEFQVSLEVRPQDVNYGGHLGNDHLISIVGTARAHLFRYRPLPLTAAAMALSTFWSVAETVTGTSKFEK